LLTISTVVKSKITNDKGFVYVSLVDNSYIGRVGYEHDLKFLYEKNMKHVQSAKKENKCSATLGFCENEQKWYGWSHRAFFGFGIGSEVKKGDCAFKAKDKEEFRIQWLNFWDDDIHKNGVFKITEVAQKNNSGIIISYT